MTTSVEEPQNRGLVVERLPEEENENEVAF